jgi:GNAT superfamily N-acetyltransferase
MAAEKVRIERVKLKDLEAVAARFIDFAKPGAFIPITKHRAAAMARNPHGQPDDVALLLATEGERCVGYFGVMAVARCHPGKLQRVHWLTTWAVSEDYRGKGLGSRLMEEALALDVDLAIVGSKPARRVSAKYGFVEAKPLHYVQLDFGVAGRFNPISLLLRGLRKLFSLIKLRLSIQRLDDFFVRLFEVLLGFLFRPLFFWLAQRKAGGVDAAALAASVSPLVAPVPQGTFFHRDPQTLNWMLSYPWVVPQGKSDSDDLTYGSTDWREDFEIFAWKLESAGFVLFQSSRIRGRGMLKVLDSEGLPPRRLLALALRAAGQRNAAVIEGSHELAEPLGWLRPFLVVRKQRTLQLHPRAADSPLAQALPALQQRYTDGDMAFT